KVNIDENLLQEIAAETGGKYFRAKGDRALTEIYSEIDQLEKTKINITTTRQYTERFHPLALIAIALVFIELLLRLTVFKQFP
ncbi:MAG TPA: aerotolerance regulator BatA, partial [Agriterribacter sp.]|nr:aerotolerance regulator BatA [Agriterribacter sp.]